MEAWHTLEQDLLLQELGVDPSRGLEEDEVERRRTRFGPNALEETKRRSRWNIFAAQFTSFLVLLLIAAGLISGTILGEWLDASIILAIVILNAALGFRQEYAAERAMEALKKLATPVLRVKRGGHVRSVPSTELVPGDVIFLEAGSLVPADGRVVEVAELRVEEASLTGESEPVVKQTAAIADRDVPLGDRKNMVFAGTAVTYGRGQAVVVATGMATELGRIAGKLQGVVKDRTPLQKQLHRLGFYLVIAALILIALVVLTGRLRGDEWETLFLTAVAMAVAAVPEGLPAVVTVALALGARRMLARRALIRKLPAVETLGSVTTICSDKTGTLTQNRMTVTLLVLGGERLDLSVDGRREGAAAKEELAAIPDAALLLAAGALCNDAVFDESTEGGNGSKVLGDPTEAALVIAAADNGLLKDSLEAALPRVGEAPFDSIRKRMTTVHALPDGNSRNEAGFLARFRSAEAGTSARYVCFAKGALDSILEICPCVWNGGSFEEMSAAARERLLTDHDNLAQDGLRVLGVAFRLVAERPRGMAEIEQDMVFLGLVGMLDPVRPEAVEAVRRCQTAGIRVVMITGDHPLMARHIGRRLGLVEGRRDSSSPEQKSFVTGRELSRLSPEDLQRRVEATAVYARVSPEHKLDIVNALRARGHICAMTGDGVNDAPALKAADIGVAMGLAGTDVAREASDMVLMDDNFATIVAAVEEGRTIFANIRRFIRYLLACNTGELMIFLAAPFLGMPLPLLPVQILWMNLVTDGFPALALGVEGPEADVMNRPPRDPRGHILGWDQVVYLLVIGALIAAVASALGYAYWSGWGGLTTGLPHPGGAAAGGSTWQTMLFCTMVFAQIFFAFAERSDRDSLFKIGIAGNRQLLYAVGATIVLQLAVVYLPFGRAIFRTVPLGPGDLGLTLAAGLTVLAAGEIIKWGRRRTRC